MIKALSIILVVVVVASFTKASTVSQRILGGAEVEPHSLPYQALIDTEFDTYNLWCGASLISRNYVLTAAHCLYNPPNILVAVIITLGAHTLNVNEVEQYKQRVPAANVLRHTTSDAALIRTEQSITFTWAIQAIRLPQLAERNLGFTGYAATASGWGKSEAGYLQSLRAVTMIVMSEDSCRRYYGSMASSIVCLEGASGQSINYGDSGGPLAVRTQAGELTQIGVASFISNDGNLSAFARLTSIIDWLKANSDAPIF